MQVRNKHSQAPSPSLGSARLLHAARKANAVEIAENLASIAAVPAELWPSAADLLFALHWARCGYDCFAYRSISGIWNLWLGWRRIELGRDPTGSGAGKGVQL